MTVSYLIKFSIIVPLNLEAEKRNHKKLIFEAKEVKCI